jgi:hypothetical protein
MTLELDSGLEILLSWISGPRLRKGLQESWRQDSTEEPGDREGGGLWSDTKLAQNCCVVPVGAARTRTDCSLKL